MNRYDYCIISKNGFIFDSFESFFYTVTNIYMQLNRLMIINNNV